MRKTLAVTGLSGLALVAVLAGCTSTGGDTASPPTAAVTSAAAANTDAFVTAFKQAFPTLAAGRSDAAIADDAKNTCADITSADGEPIALKHIPPRFERNGITPDDATAAAILALVKTTGCG
jgi:hypothetical protein